MYRRLGAPCARWGSLARIGRPVALRAGADDPVVRSLRQRVVRRAARQQVDGRGGATRRGRRCGELRARGRQCIRLPKRRKRQHAGIESGRQRGHDLGDQRTPQPVHARRIGAVLAVHLGAVDLVGEVQRQSVVPDADDVGRLPARGPVPEKAELLGKQIGLPLREIDVGVDAGDECLGDALGVRGIREPLAVQVAAKQHRPCHAVALDVGRPEVLRHLAEPALPPEVDLPQPVARGDEALRGEGVVEPFGVDVRHAPFIHQHLHGTFEARHDRGRQRGLTRTAGHRGEQERDEQQRERSGACAACVGEVPPSSGSSVDADA